METVYCRTVRRAPCAVALIVSFAAAVNAGAASIVYVGNFKDNTVSVIDAGAGKAIATVPVAAGPHGIAFKDDSGSFVRAESSICVHDGEACMAGSGRSFRGARIVLPHGQDGSDHGVFTPLPGPGLTSDRRRVPAGGPSVPRGSRPWIPSSPAKCSVPPMTVAPPE